MGVHKVRNTEELIPTLFQDTIQVRTALSQWDVMGCQSRGLTESLSIRVSVEARTRPG